MNLNRRTFMTGIVGALALPVAVRAQEDSSGLLQQIPGLETAYARRYAPASDLPHIDSDVEETDATPAYMIIMALEFENEMMLQGVMGSMLSPDIAATIMQWHGEPLTETTLDELPEGNKVYIGEDEEAHDPYSSLIVLPVGNMGYLVRVDGASEAVQQTANDVASFLAEAEPSDAPVTVVAEGVAEGGAFDVFPGIDDLDMLGGTLPLYDYDLLVSDSPILPDGATPEASPES